MWGMTMQNECNKNHTHSGFAAYHPLVCLVYFVIITAVTVLVLHPIYLIISLIGACCYAYSIDGMKSVRFTIQAILPMMAFVMVINPLFHHGGVTVLWYFPSGNPLTLESILYGVGNGVMMAAMLLWFRCYTKVMTADKFVYLFGKVLPALSLVISMTLRFVPMFFQQFQQIRETQKGIGRDITDGTMIERIGHGITILSILITWALEHAIETADSMKSRGYGLPGRTAFAIYRLEKRDKVLLTLLCVLSVYMVFLALSGAMVWQYYPFIRGGALTPAGISGVLCYFILSILPTAIYKREEHLWRTIETDCPLHV